MSKPKPAPPRPMLPGDKLPAICPLKDSNVSSGYEMFEAMESLKSQQPEKTFLFLFYTKCSICRTDKGEPRYHWSVFSLEQVRWARAIDPFFLHGGRDEEPGIYRVDLNTLYRMRRYRDWLGALGDWINEHPHPPYYNEWQTSEGAPNE